MIRRLIIFAAICLALGFGLLYLEDCAEKHYRQKFEQEREMEHP